VGQQALYDEVASLALALLDNNFQDYASGYGGATAGELYSYAIWDIFAPSASSTLSSDQQGAIATILTDYREVGGKYYNSSAPGEVVIYVPNPTDASQEFNRKGP